MDRMALIDVLLGISADERAKIWDAVTREERRRAKQQRVEALRRYAMLVHGGLSCRRQAKAIAGDIAVFAGSLWPKNAYRAVAPAHFSPKNAALFELMKMPGNDCSVRTIRKHLGQK